MGFNSAFKGLKLLKTPGNRRLNNLNDPNRPQCVNIQNSAFRMKSGVHKQRMFSTFLIHNFYARHIIMYFCFTIGK